MNLALPKQFMLWRGRPLYWHSAVAFSRSGSVDGLVFVFPPEDIEREQERLCRLLKTAEVGLPWRVTSGGERRQDSVKNALAALPPDCELVYIHDAARPFLTPRLINRVASALSEEMAGAIPCVKVVDTIKRSEDGATASGTLPRDKLLAAQTPQLFRVDKLREAHEGVANVTDDASMLEALGEKIGVCEGERENVKITYPEDLALLRDRRSEIPRSGFGYDVHKFGGDRPLKLGGVLIPGDWSVRAHSDGDVVLHALIDAILGCIGAGDIGDHFPDSDPAFEGVSSAALLDDVLDMARDAKFQIDAADITIIAQKPKLSGHKREIAKNVARLLNLSPERVNVKATTEEGLGFTGRVEGLKCVALVSGRIFEEGRDDGYS